MKKMLMIVILTFGLVSISACSSSDIETDAVNQIEVEAKALNDTSYGTVIDYDYDSSVAESANNFGFEFSKNLLEEADNNFICSPLSAYIVLACVGNGTDDDSFNELKDTLNIDKSITLDEINNTVSRMIYDLTSSYGETDAVISLANAIFVDKDYELNKEFVQVLADYYRVAAFETDFDSQMAVDAVNAWASENTNGKIAKIITEFSPGTIVELCNAIYFDAAWTNEFEEINNTEDSFVGRDETTKTTFMNQEYAAMYYYTDDRIEAVVIPYYGGSGMVVILPKDGDANAVIHNMNSDYFNDIMNDGENKNVTLMLPKFEINSDSMKCLDALNKMGFTLDDQAGLPSIVDGENLVVSAVTQKAMIDVNEYGTIAAAVTIVDMKTTSMPMFLEKINFDCDRPFAFIVYSRTTDCDEQVLFTGVLNNIE